VLVGAETTRIDGKSRAEAVVLADGRVLPADLVIAAIGVRPNVELARSAGVAIDRGVLVDDRLTTSIAGIHAIGECAQHRGQCYGLVEPAYEQARVLATHLAGRPAAYGGSVVATNLKVSGVRVFSAGDFLGAPGTEQVVLSDTGLGTYKKLVLAGNRLVGAVLYGETNDAAWYLELIRTGTAIGHIRDELMFGRAAAERKAA